ncbi:ATP-binding cassette domain-containing protein [Streptomyces sp. NPDC059152]|uniref:ATP-binding cassette domain-containing protein n=1 Tax=Streptomyces sp. NPDC059152 TaxID=3346742 RepID=UPI0036BF1C25
MLRTGWQADPRALTGVVVAQLGQGVAAGWGLVAVNSVLTKLFANGPTADRLRDALPSLAVLAVTAVAAAVLSAWSTAMSGRLEPQVERAVSARCYTAVTGVEVEATERPEVQRLLEAGKFGTDSARSMLRLSVGVGNVVIGMLAAAVVLVSLHWALLPMLLAVAVPKGWGTVRSARRDYISRLHWVDHRRAISSLLAYLTRPHTAAEIRAHAAGTKLLASYEEMSRQTESEQRRGARAHASTDLVAGGFAGLASLGCYGVLWWLLAAGGLPLAVGGTAVVAIRSSTARLTSLVQQVNRLYEELLFLTDTERAIEVSHEHAIPRTGVALPAPVQAVRAESVTFTYPGAASPALKDVSVEIRRGAVTALVGANGSGKTTLTKIFAGLLLPSRSSRLMLGVEVAQFDACIVGGELPIHLALVGVGGVLPGREFGVECVDQAFDGVPLLVEVGVVTDGPTARRALLLPVGGLVLLLRDHCVHRTSAWPSIRRHIAEPRSCARCAPVGNTYVKCSPRDGRVYAKTWDGASPGAGEATGGTGIWAARATT